MVEDQDFTNQKKMNPFDIIFMFLILPIVATTTCWIILKDSKNNGKDRNKACNPYCRAR